MFPYFSGIDNFCLDLQFMTKGKVGIYWRICWGVIMPVLLIVIFVYFIATLEPLTYGIDDLLYPDGITGMLKSVVNILQLLTSLQMFNKTFLYLIFCFPAIGWCILGAGVVQAVGWFFYYLYANREYPPRRVSDLYFYYLKNYVLRNY